MTTTWADWSMAALVAYDELASRCAHVAVVGLSMGAGLAALVAHLSDEDLAKAVKAETRGHDYDELILATGRQDGSRLARILHLCPVHQLRRRWGSRLTVFEAAA